MSVNWTEQNKKEKQKTLTTGRIARYCHVTTATVINWIEKGKLKAYQLPLRGDRRVFVRDFIDFLNENEMPIPDELVSRAKRALVVEDEAITAEAIRHLLVKLGFEVETVSDGFQAGSLLESWDPTIMTLDLKMSGIDGFEVLRFLRRANGKRRDVKIVVVSAMSDEMLEEAVRMGADEAIAKPFNFERLAASVKRLVEEVKVVGQKYPS